MAESMLSVEGLGISFGGSGSTRQHQFSCAARCSDRLDWAEWCRQDDDGVQLLDRLLSSDARTYYFFKVKAGKLMSSSCWVSRLLWMICSHRVAFGE